LWHDPKDRAFATVGRLSRPVNSPAFRRLLLNEYRNRTGVKVPGAEAIAGALRVIEAKAVCECPEHEAHVRVAGHGDRVYLYLADRDARVVEVDADGWRLCDSPPVRIRQPSGMRPLPLPERGGDIEHLRAFLNVADDGAFALVLGWLAGTFQPAGPFPLMVLLGEQGTAKSTTGRVLKRLIDPGEAELRSEPREGRDLMIAARNGWALAFDNLSYLPPWLSDALCRMATEGGFSTRVLYTDDDEMIFEAKRPILLNGIDAFVTRADLLERSILLRHPPIREENRRPESSFWSAFDAAHAKLLGALLDRVSAGLRELPRVNLDRLPRMADFARFAVACERGAGEGSQFLAAYADNQAGAHEQALDSSPIPAALVAFMTRREEWEGPASELLEVLTGALPNTTGSGPVRPHGWPKRPNELGNVLRRAAPNLRRVHGLHVDCNGRTHRGRVIHITRGPDGGGKTSSRSSRSSRDPENRALPRDDAPGSDPTASTRRRHARDPEKAYEIAARDDRDDRDDVSDHCRDEQQVHVRGCWVVDLVLGKA
jgi:hypothetical protein